MAIRNEYQGGKILKGMGIAIAEGGFAAFPKQARQSPKGLPSLE